MEPGHEDREYVRDAFLPALGAVASMEPGHEDREYSNPSRRHTASASPQWSPVMKTGNTS